MARAFQGKPKLKAEGVHTGINLLGLLEGLDRLLRLVLAQVTATHNVVGCRIVLVQINRPLAFSGRAIALAGKQQCVGQVQMRIQALRRELDRLLVVAHRISEISFFEAAPARTHEALEVLGMASRTNNERQNDRGQYDGQNPKQVSFHVEAARRGLIPIAENGINAFRWRF